MRDGDTETTIDAGVLAPSVDDDPYRGRRAPLALRLTALTGRVDPTVSMPGTIAEGYRKFGLELWETARVALAYWAPARLELEALRRADDAVTPSLIAEESARLTDLYQGWLVGEHDMEAHWMDPAVRSMNTARLVLGNSMLRERIAETLLAIERRAMSVEARALDIRLRVEHEKLRAQLRREEVASVFVEAMREAARLSETEEQLRMVAGKLDRLSALEDRLGKLGSDVEFVADMATEDFARREMQPPALTKVRRLGELTTSVVAKAVLSALWDKLKS